MPFTSRFPYVVLVGLFGVWLAGCDNKPAPATTPSPDTASPAASAVFGPQPSAASTKTTPAETGLTHPDALRFRDRAGAAGLHYKWEIPGPRPLTILQTIGNGCAFLDYDNDGNLDVLLVGSKLALYRGDGKGHFTEVTKAVGLDRLSGRFLGCAVGDYDGDGFQDVYVSGYHTGVLLHNQSGKSFRDVTQQAGLKPQPWGTCCAWGEMTPGSGRLDLYVGNYYRFENAPDVPQFCEVNGVKTSCGPPSYKPLRGVFYRNLGNGKFADASTEFNIPSTHGGALGAAFLPTAQGKPPTLAIANDEQPTDLLVPTEGAAPGQFTYENQALPVGIAVNSLGSVFGGMGIDWADYDNDGKLDVMIMTFQNEINNLYHNTGEGIFENVSLPTKFSPRRFSKTYVAFACKFADFDNDGWLDVMVTNGHTRDNIDKFDHTTSYREPTQVFHNLGGEQAIFEELSATSGEDVKRPIVGRGLAVGDYDNDGKVDVLVVDSEGAPLLLHNESKAGNSVRVRLIGTKSNRDGLGALLTATVGGRVYVRLCQTDGSYLSASDRRVSFGLGSATKIDTLQIDWPSGKSDTLHDVPIGKEIVVREGGK